MHRLLWKGQFRCYTLHELLHGVLHLDVCVIPAFWRRSYADVPKLCLTVDEMARVTQLCSSIVRTVDVQTRVEKGDWVCGFSGSWVEKRNNFYFMWNVCSWLESLQENVHFMRSVACWNKRWNSNTKSASLPRRHTYVMMLTEEISHQYYLKRPPLWSSGQSS
jgi:hypothetical protein